MFHGLRNFLVSNLQPLNLKLIEDKYCYWQAQVLFFVGALELEDHLTGLIFCTNPFVFTNDELGANNVKQLNVKYSIWKKYKDCEVEHQEVYACTPSQC